MNVVFRLKSSPSLKLRYLPGIVGPSGSVELGTVTTGAAGTNVIITNSGTPQAAVLNFTIPRGNTGATGDKGWSPILAIVTDGARRVVQISDWTGGQGTKPAVGDYIGPTGLTSNIASAVDIRGATGPAGSVTDGDKGDITVTGTGATWTIDANVIGDTKLRQGAALSVIGRTSNTTGNVADIVAGTDGYVLVRVGTTLVFAQVLTAGIANSAVTLAKQADIATGSIMGRSTAGTGVQEVLTPALARGVIGGGYVIDRQVASAATDVRLTLPAGFDEFILEISRYVGSTADELAMQVSYNGTTFDTTANYTTKFSFATGGTIASVASSTAAFFDFLTVDPPVSDTTKALSTLKFYPGSASDSFRMKGDTEGFSNANAAMTQYWNSYVKPVTSRPVMVKLYNPTGTVSGTFILKGLGA